MVVHEIILSFGAEKSALLFLFNFVCSLYATQSKTARFRTKYEQQKTPSNPHKYRENGVL